MPEITKTPRVTVKILAARHFLCRVEAAAAGDEAQGLLPLPSPSIMREHAYAGILF